MYFEPVLGLRTWQISPGVRPALTGTTIKDGWNLDAPTRAVCRRDEFRELFVRVIQYGGARFAGIPEGYEYVAGEHDAPHNFCRCGLYAYNFEHPLVEVSGSMAHGAVIGWGRIILHEHGWRAEFARPVAFYGRGNRDLSINPAFEAIRTQLEAPLIPTEGEFRRFALTKGQPIAGA